MLKILLLFLNFSIINAQYEEYTDCEMKIIQITYDKFKPKEVTVKWCGGTCDENCSLVPLADGTQKCFKLHMKKHTLLDLTSVVKLQHKVCGCNSSSLQKCYDTQKSIDLDNCSCKCTNQTLIDGCLGDTRIWDSNICRCVAKKKECTTTTFWNKLTNRCEINI